jgi:hypothetical protein
LLRLKFVTGIPLVLSRAPTNVCFGFRNCSDPVLTGVRLARGSDCESNVAKITGQGEPREPKSGLRPWDRTYQICRVDGGELNVRVTSTHKARTAAKLPGNEEALEVLENHGALKALELAEKVTPPPVRGGAPGFLEIWFELSKVDELEKVRVRHSYSEPSGT